MCALIWFICRTSHKWDGDANSQGITQADTVAAAGAAGAAEVRRKAEAEQV